MKLTVTLEQTRETRQLTEFTEVHIGRQPLAAAAIHRIQVAPSQLVASLSRTALVIRNDNDSISLRNEQSPDAGRVWFTKDGEFQELPVIPRNSESPAPGRLSPVPKNTQVRIELFDGILRELTIHIQANGAPLRPGGERTQRGFNQEPDGPVVQDWEVAINAFQCARLAGGKLTDAEAMGYFRRKMGGSAGSNHAFRNARRKAGTLLLKDPACGPARLLEVAGRYIDPLLVQEMMDGGDT